MKDAQLSRLQDLLERERYAILYCDFNKLEIFSEEKEAIVRGLLSVPLNREDLAVVFGLMTRSQRLLEAAMKGVRTAENSLAVIDQVIHGSSFYGCDGQINHTPNDVMRISRKV